FFVVEALFAGAEAIPATVRDAVLARAARLDPDARALLDAVAIVPPRAELWLLESIAGELVAHLDECLGSGMLASDTAGVAFRHELARLALEESVPLKRKVDLHRKAPAALTEPPFRAPDPGRPAAPRRSGGRRRRRSALRPSGGGPRSVARLLPGGCGAVREGAPVRRPPDAGRPGRAARGALACVLPDRSERRGDRRARGRRRVTPKHRAAARGGRGAAVAVGDPLVPGPGPRIR